ncbi:TPA: hypothetical protein ACH3X2_010573 [Trebouxia sp. C0005]
MASQPGPIKLLQMISAADLFRTSPTLLVDRAGDKVDLEVLQPLMSRCIPLSSVSNQKQQLGVQTEGTCFAPDKQSLPAVLAAIPTARSQAAAWEAVQKQLLKCLMTGSPGCCTG